MQPSGAQTEPGHPTVFSPRRRELWIIFLVALAVRIVYVSSLREGYYFSDFRAYESAALSLLDGEGFGPEYDRPPLYPLFLAGNYLVMGKHFFTVRLVQALLGAYCSVLIFLIAVKVLGLWAGRLSGLISVFYPYYVFLSGLLYPTLLTTFFLLGVIFFLFQAMEKKSILCLVFAAFSLSLAALATPASLAFLPFLLIWFIFISKLVWKQRLIFAGVSLAVVLLCLLPWTYYSYQRSGQLVLIDARAERHLPQMDKTAAGSGSVSNGSLQGIAANPGKFALRVGKEFLHFWSFIPDRIVSKDEQYLEKRHKDDPRLMTKNPFVSPWLNYVSILTYGPVFILGILGLILLRNKWWALSLLFLLLMSQALGYSLFFTQVRYRLPVEFCLMIFAGGGAIAVWNLLSKNHKMRSA